MTEDPISEIDSTLAEELPGLEKNPDSPIDENKREDMIRLLRHAADELGKAPTYREFDSLNLEVSSNVISKEFGTWNEAKEAAELETWQRGTVREINETYFQSINSPKKAYWFGTIFATSSLRPQPKGGKYALVLGRTEDKAYFITEFADAIESDYPINWTHGNKSDKQQVRLAISNPTFIDHLLNAGYPDPEDDPGRFPSIKDKYLPSFLRGFLESSGYFRTDGWHVTVANSQRGEQIQEWFEQFGAKRPTVSQVSSGAIVVHVVNNFDIKAIFESLWPDLLETEPSWEPYPQKILQYLESEYPYPENLSYLDG